MRMSISSGLLRLVAVMLSLTFTLRGAAQQYASEGDRVVDFMSRVMRFNQWRPQEKVYLHLDNTGYFKGETIWFTGYVVRTDDGSATDLSHILYVELLNPSGDVVERRKLPINDGVAYGDIKVDSIMVTGFYEVRAFTRYMTNWGTNACFSRIIPIFNAPKYEGVYNEPVLDKISYRNRLNNERAKSIDVKNENIVDMTGDDVDEKESKLANVHFYPEGGNLVEGLPANVAFTVTDDEGKPTSQMCTVYDANGKVVASQCVTDDKGFGSFVLPEVTNGMYLQIDKGKKYELPKPLTDGCAIQMDMLADDVVTLTIRTSKGVQGELLGLVMTHNGNLCYGDTMRAEGLMSREFVRTELPKGVSQLTLYNAEGRIMAERMIFVRPDIGDMKEVKITSPTTTLKPCGKVKYNITTQPNASLSFSAIDADGLVNGIAGNMYTWMLLSSELRGYIANPEYYFEADDAEHRHAADLLMMIQGWRRYDWKLMTGQSMFMKFQPIENKQYLFGRLRQKTKKATVENVWLDTKLYNSAGQVIEGTTKTDSLGNYVYELPEIEGEWRLLINTGKAGKDGYWEDLNYYTAIDRNFSPEGKYVSPLEASPLPVDTANLFRWKFTPEQERWISQLNRTRVLKNVTVTATKRFWDRTNWGNETNPQRHSTKFYNCDLYSDQAADEGEPMPSFAAWLMSVNSLFTGTEEPTDGYSLEVDTNIIGTTGSIYKLKAEGSYVDSTGNPLKFFKDGPGYNNRPIVWVVDNQFHRVTGLPTMSTIEVNHQDSESLSTFPETLDEVKSVYISEDMTLLHNHFQCPQIDSRNPVTVFVYTHRTYLYNQKGLRRTHYQGYNVPSTFEMEDYSDIPPIEDFRRTLYWQPVVNTDATGNAVVEFWNNSIAKQMKIMCEGMTKKGEIQVFK